MPLDPSIPLGVRTPEPSSPMRTLGGMFQLRAMQQQTEAGQLALDDKRRADAEERAVQDAFRSSGGDVHGAIKQLETAGYGMVAMGLRGKVAEQQSKRAEEIGKTLANQKAALTIAAQIAQGIGDEDSFQVGRRAIGAILGPELAQQLGDRYDPARLQQAVAWGTERSHFLDQQDRAIKNALEAGKMAQAASKDAREWQAKRPEIVQKWTASVGGMLALTRNQQEWDGTLTQFHQNGVEPEILAQFGRQWSPGAAQRAGLLAMTPDQRADNAHAAATLGETRRHNLTTEAETARHHRETATATRPLTQTAEAGLVDKLSKQWAAATANQTEMQRQLQIMRTGISRFDADPNSASQAVLVTFQKILDPESVVREAEYARSAQGLSTLRRMEGWMEQKLKGGAGVPKAELLEMVKTAEQFIENTKDGRNGVRRRLAATASRYNIPQELVFGDSGETAPAAASAPPAVVSALRGQKDGRYTMTDGSVWVLEGGQIRKGS